MGASLLSAISLLPISVKFVDTPVMLKEQVRNLRPVVVGGGVERSLGEGLRNRLHLVLQQKPHCLDVVPPVHEWITE